MSDSIDTLFESAHLIREDFLKDLPPLEALYAVTLYALKDDPDLQRVIFVLTQALIEHTNRTARKARSTEEPK
jgi:hypothetical protein